MELLERSDESTYPAVAMYPTPESPPLWVTGCQSLGPKEAQTVPAQGSAREVFPLQLLEGRYHLLVRVPQTSRAYNSGCGQSLAHRSF